MIDKGAPKNNSKNGQGKKSSFRSIGVSKMNPPNIIHSNNKIVPLFPKKINIIVYF